MKAITLVIFILIAFISGCSDQTHYKIVYTVTEAGFCPDIPLYECPSRAMNHSTNQIDIVYGRKRLAVDQLIVSDCWANSKGRACNDTVRSYYGE